MTCHAHQPGVHPKTFVCGGKVRQRARSCVMCPEPHVRLCDWKLRDGVTCDTPLCEGHSYATPDDKDLCPRHAHQALVRGFQVTRRAEPPKQQRPKRERPAPQPRQGSLL